MASIKQFEDIDAWKEARELAKAVYFASNSGVFAKDFDLRDQMRRASVSILSNIAEGFERGGDREFFQFLSVAKGSCGEVRAQLCIAIDQGYLAESEFNQLRDQTLHISRMLASFMIYLRRSNLGGVKFKTDSEKGSHARISARDARGGGSKSSDLRPQTLDSF